MSNFVDKSKGTTTSETRSCPVPACGHLNRVDAEFCSVCGSVMNIPAAGSSNRRRAKQSIIREFFLFIKHEKKWWLVPLLLLLVIIGAFVVFASSSPLAPFLYPLF